MKKALICPIKVEEMTPADLKVYSPKIITLAYIRKHYADELVPKQVPIYEGRSDLLGAFAELDTIDQVIGYLDALKDAGWDSFDVDIHYATVDIRSSRVAGYEPEAVLNMEKRVQQEKKSLLKQKRAELSEYEIFLELKAKYEGC